MFLLHISPPDHLFDSSQEFVEIFFRRKNELQALFVQDIILFVRMDVGPISL